MDETKRGVLDTRNKEIQYNILKRESDTNRTLYDGLLQQYKDAGIAGAVGTNNVAIIDRAQVPGGPFKPNLRNDLLIWLVLGLVAAACAVRISWRRVGLPAINTLRRCFAEVVGQLQVFSIT